MSNPLINHPYYQNPAVQPLVTQPRLQYPYPQNYPVQTGPIPTASADPFTWVDGPVQAEAYRVGAGQTAVLWDSAQGSNRIYIKSTDGNGIPQPMRVLEYSDVTEQRQNTSKNDAVGFVTLDEVNEIVEQKINEHFKNRNKNRKPRPRREEDGYEE